LHNLRYPLPIRRFPFAGLSPFFVKEQAPQRLTNLSIARFDGNATTFKRGIDLIDGALQFINFSSGGDGYKVGVWMKQIRRVRDEGRFLNKASGDNYPFARNSRFAGVPLG
jgi:hypothetical protein